MTAKSKIFIIGFNRCGTQSLAFFFRHNGLRVEHIGDRYKKFNEFVKKNISEGRPIFGSESVDVYADATELVDYYQKLATDYPESYFILNTRDKDRWINSRLRHGPDYCLFLNDHYGLNRTKEEWIETWSKEWDNHHKEVQEYFAPNPERLLVFNIEKDPVDKVVVFLEKSHKLNPQHWRHIGAGPGTDL